MDVVLVIDDEAPIRRVVRNAVEAGIGTVLEAATGREGIDRAAVILRDVTEQKRAEERLREYEKVV